MDVIYDCLSVVIYHVLCNSSNLWQVFEVDSLVHMLINVSSFFGKD